jgi:hypothetical protein
VRKLNSAAVARVLDCFWVLRAEHVTHGLNRSVVKRISLVTPVFALKALSEVPVHQNLPLPNEDFGRMNKR